MSEPSMDAFDAVLRHGHDHTVVLIALCNPALTVEQQAAYIVRYFETEHPGDSSERAVELLVRWVWAMLARIVCDTLPDGASEEEERDIMRTWLTRNMLDEILEMRTEFAHRMLDSGEFPLPDVPDAPDFADFPDPDPSA